ncbi:MAG: hypothetical protein ABSG20_17570 [Bradyrhizobium sp.]
MCLFDLGRHHACGLFGPPTGQIVFLIGRHDQVTQPLCVDAASGCGGLAELPLEEPFAGRHPVASWIKVNDIV